MFRKKKKDFFDYQPFVCPCAVHCDSEHKQINLYLDKNFYGQLLYATLNQKELGELLHCFCNKNVVFVMIMISAFIAKN